jgi:uncharacterized protein
MRKQIKFISLVFALSIPFWLLGYWFDSTNFIPVRLPFSALQFLSVLAAAVIVTKSGGGSVSSLLKRGFDFNRITKTGWRFGIFLIMPLTVVVSLMLIQWNGFIITDTSTPFWTIPLFLCVYGVSGYCEQTGWTAITTDSLLSRFNVIITGLLVGITWATWHIIPFTQTHHDMDWIIWQCIYSIVFRILITKIYVLTNTSVFATIALHATYNTGFSMMPYYGSSYNPMYMVIATSIIGSIIFLLSFTKRMIHP